MSHVWPTASTSTSWWVKPLPSDLRGLIATSPGDPRQSTHAMGRERRQGKVSKGGGRVGPCRGQRPPPLLPARCRSGWSTPWSSASRACSGSWSAPRRQLPGGWPTWRRSSPRQGPARGNPTHPAARLPGSSVWPALCCLPLPHAFPVLGALKLRARPCLPHRCALGAGAGGGAHGGRARGSCRGARG
jgi:hypothetical protein